MWPAFLLGMFSEFFNESKEPNKFLVKGLASGAIGLVLNFVVWLLFAHEASTLIGFETPTWTSISIQFIIVPFVAAFVALIIVKSARYFSNLQ